MGQACAKEVESFLDLHVIHHETTASGTKQEMPVAEQSNATFSQGARANLAGVQITSQDGGGGRQEMARRPLPGRMRGD